MDYEIGFSTPELSKTSQITSQVVLDGGFDFFSLFS
jgi:hypothetical protein